MIIRISEQDVIVKVRVVSGETLALLDKTGTLTTKYQARLVIGSKTEELIADKDTELLIRFVQSKVNLTDDARPINQPNETQLVAIEILFDNLKQLVGSKFPDAGRDQERNRGAALHRLVCKILGYTNYQDDGQFPDVLHQLLEVKLQTSATIDLGLVRPDSEMALYNTKLGDEQIRHCDVRYALFFATQMARKSRLHTYT